MPPKTSAAGKTAARTALSRGTPTNVRRPTPGDVDFTPALNGAGAATKKMVESHIKDAKQIWSNVQSTACSSTERVSRQTEERVDKLLQQVQKRKHILHQSNQENLKKVKRLNTGLEAMIKESMHALNQLERQKKKREKVTLQVKQISFGLCEKVQRQCSAMCSVETSARGTTK